MKKYFCFHCQKEVTPYGISFKAAKWLFCPKCLRRITDDGSGFYRICDHCGANTSPDAAVCPKCGFVFDPQGLIKQKQTIFIKKLRFYDIALGIAVICAIFLITVALFYLSFYILIIIFAAALFNWLLDKTKQF